MTIYLSPSVKHFTDDPFNFGCMFNIARQIGGQWDALENGCRWIIDNNQYKNGWTWAAWWHFLCLMADYKATCLGIPIPDRVGDAIMTLRLFRVYHGVIREMDYPVALVTQDGMTSEMIPWPDVDCLFIGGSNYHKRGKEAQELIFEAKRQGKWIHVGRTQAGSTMLTHWPQADSFDGTTLIKHPTQQRQSIIDGVCRIRRGQVPFMLKML